MLVFRQHVHEHIGIAVFKIVSKPRTADILRVSENVVPRLYEPIIWQFVHDWLTLLTRLTAWNKRTLQTRGYRA